MVFDRVPPPADVGVIGTLVLAVRFWRNQIAELHARIAVLNGDTALDIPVTEVVGQARPGKGVVRPSPDLRDNAALALSGRQFPFLIACFGTSSYKEADPSKPWMPVRC